MIVCDNDHIKFQHKKIKLKIQHHDQSLNKLHHQYHEMYCENKPNTIKFIWATDE